MDVKIRNTREVEEIRFQGYCLLQREIIVLYLSSIVSILNRWTSTHCRWIGDQTYCVDSDSATISSWRNGRCVVWPSIVYKSDWIYSEAGRSMRCGPDRGKHKCHGFLQPASLWHWSGPLLRKMCQEVLNDVKGDQVAAPIGPSCQTGITQTTLACRHEMDFFCRLTLVSISDTQN